MWASLQDVSSLNLRGSRLASPEVGVEYRAEAAGVGFPVGQALRGVGL